MTNWQHPSFFAYVSLAPAHPVRNSLTDTFFQFPCNATFAGILGDVYASALTNPGFNWNCSPAATELENVVMDWAADLFGLAPIFKLTSGKGGGGGVIQATACDSVLVAAISARSQLLAVNPTISLDDMVIYVSSQTHSLGVKAARILGMRVKVLQVTEEDEYALRGETVRAAYEEDRAAGRWPFFISESNC